jgi:TM2 domain-containing membrane protein YozV
MRQTDLGLAYLFWLPSITGIAGLHRFYLGKPLTGFLYLITVGLFGIGTFYDAIMMPRLVRRVRLEDRLDRILDEELYGGDAAGQARDVTPPGELFGARRSRKPRTLEHAILTLADQRHGIVTPARVALVAAVSAEKARDGLDRLVQQGFADVRVSRDGLMLYIFPEFLDKAGQEELDSLT